jgi:hypothetical protein
MLLEDPLLDEHGGASVGFPMRAMVHAMSGVSRSDLG